MNAAPRSREPRIQLGLLAVVLLTLAVYAPSLGNGFAMDGVAVACPQRSDGSANPMVAELRPLPEYFATNYHHGEGQVSNLYRPLTILSYALLNQARRPGAGARWAALPHHVLNVLLQAAATLLVFALVRRLGAPGGPALVAAAVFGLHAIHSEVVAGVVGRAELLAFCCGAAATVVLPLAGERGAAWRRAVAAGLLFLAFCSKENGLGWAGFSVVFALARRWQAGGAGTLLAVARREAPGWLATIGPPVAAFFALRAGMIAALPQSPPPPELIVNPLAHTDALTRVQTAIALWGYGALLNLAPLWLCADYSVATFELVRGALEPRLLGAVILLGASLAGGLWCGRRHPLLLLAVAAFFGFGVITSNVAFAIGTIFGERLYYAPSLGVACLAAWLASRAAGRRRLLAAALTAWLGVNAWVIVERNPVWRDSDTLFVHEVARNPASVRLRVCAAAVFARRGGADIAVAHLRAALALMPDYAPAWNHLGFVLWNAGEPEAAVGVLRQALRHAEEHGLAWSSAELMLLHINLAGLLRELGDPDAAAAHAALADEHRRAAAARSPAGPAKGG